MSEKINEIIAQHPIDDTGYVFDFDNTIVSTSGLFYALLRTTARVAGPELAQRLNDYNDKRKELKERRPAFHPDEILGDQTNAVYEEYPKVVEEMGDFVYEDAREFIRKIRALGGTAVILTFAEDVAYQEAKLGVAFNALNFTLPYLIIGQKNKAKALSEMQQNDGKYHFVDGDGGEHIFTHLVGVGDSDTDFAMDGYSYDQLPNATGIRRVKKDGVGLYEEI